eukprot:164978-Prorocentrum_lima.AAC.1
MPGGVPLLIVRSGGRDRMGVWGHRSHRLWTLSATSLARFQDRHFRLRLGGFHHLPSPPPVLCVHHVALQPGS